jgi:hypothetical protein
MKAAPRASNRPVDNRESRVRVRSKERQVRRAQAPAPSKQVQCKAKTQCISGFPVLRHQFLSRPRRSGTRPPPPPKRAARRLPHARRWPAGWQRCSRRPLPPARTHECARTAGQTRCAAPRHPDPSHPRRLARRAGCARVGTRASAQTPRSPTGLLDAVMPAGHPGTAAKSGCWRARRSRRRRPRWAPGARASGSG